MKEAKLGSPENDTTVGKLARSTARPKDVVVEQRELTDMDEGMLGKVGALSTITVNSAVVTYLFGNVPVIRIL